MRSIKTSTSIGFPFSRYFFLVVAVVLVIAFQYGAVGSASPRTGAAPCKTAATAALVQFTTAFNVGSLRALDGLVAKPSLFRWFYVSGEPGQRIDDGKNRSTLIPYFAERHGQHDQLALISAEIKSGNKSMAADFVAVFARTADDLVGGPRDYLAKGAFTCDGTRALLSVWAMGVKTPSG